MGNIPPLTSYKGSEPLWTDGICGSGEQLGYRFPLLADGTGVKPIAASVPIAAADLNGDRRLDAVTIDYRGNNVFVYLRNPDNTTRPGVAYPIAQSPAQVIIADLNSDGKLDIAATATGDYRANPGAVSILFGNGDGTFRPAVNVPAGSAPFSLAASDLNGDGKRDLVVSNSVSNNLSVLVNNGDGSFRAPVNYAVGSGSVLIAELTGDGRPDVALASFTGVFLLAGDGNGTLLAPARLAIVSGASYIGSADLNRDGRPDLAVLSSQEGSLTILLGNGSGGFQTRSKHVAGIGVRNFTFWDANGDGHVEIGVPDYYAQVLSLFFVREDGAPRAAPIYSTGEGFLNSFVLADFNLDGKTDLGGMSTQTGDVLISLGSGGHVFQRASAPSRITAQNVTAVFAGDFTGDNRPDFGIVESGANRILVLPGNANGTFQAPIPSAAGAEPIHAVSGDFNVDGKLDVAMTNRGGTISILAGSGNGSFAAPVTQTAGKDPRVLGTGDFNGDNRLDLAVVNYGTFDSATDPGSLAVFINNGNGTFRPAVQYPAGRNPDGLTIADINGDGRLDLLVPTLEGSFGFRIGTMLGNGNGTFQAIRMQATDFGPRAPVIADINIDGIRDLIVPHCCGDVMMTYQLGSADGTFGPAVKFSGGIDPTIVLAHDFNGDAKPDLAVRNAGGVAIFINNGRFPGVLTVAAGGVQPGPVAPDSIATAFGAALATATATANPGPIEVLAGTSLIVQDSSRNERSARLLWVSPGQVNFLVPAQASDGEARLLIAAADGSTSSGTVQIARVAPALFTLNGDRLVAATVLRVAADGSQSAESVFRLASGAIVAAPISLGSEADRIFLTLYGTGLRRRTNLNNVKVTIGGADCPVSYAGMQGSFVGLDQVNVELPRSLAGRGTVEVVFTADGKSANSVTLAIQ